MHYCVSAPMPYLIGVHSSLMDVSYFSRSVLSTVTTSCCSYVISGNIGIVLGIVFKIVWIMIKWGHDSQDESSQQQCKAVLTGICFWLVENMPTSGLLLVSFFGVVELFWSY